MPRTTVPAPTRATRAPLEDYHAKRNFEQTPEPDGKTRRPVRKGDRSLSFVVQKHAASHLHYDFRLELGGVLLSWALPKGPSLDPTVRRMAVRTEDHPLAYAGFEGCIPPKQYGAGSVIVWDRGRWLPLGDPQAGLAAGKLGFELQGHKLQGRWELVRMKPRGREKESWLLLKQRDAAARPMTEFDVVSAQPDSVLGLPPPPAPPAAQATPGGAVAAPLPQRLAPQLALLATAVPAQGRWLYETKFDGYRLLARIDGGVPRLFTRGGHDWTERMPALAAALATLGAGTAWLDGEVVVAGAGGAGDFNALQNALDPPGGAAAARRTTAAQPAIEYRLFDLPYFEGHDLRGAPLYARRELLAQLLQRAPPSPLLRLSEALGEGGSDAVPALQRQACAARLEGLIAKRLDSPYRGTRSGDWLKLKCQQRQEFVVGGYTDRSDDPSAVGSLLLGVHDTAGALVHAGSVGTGWDTATARALHKQLQRLRRSTTPFATATAPGRWGRRAAGQERWVQPRLVVEVSFAEWTPAGRVRHAVFVGLRSDKAAREIGRERPVAPQPRAAAAVAAPTLQITHGERVIDAGSGLRKRDLVRYYDSVAAYLLPQLQRRPVALLRAPAGVDGQQFFQKHAGSAGLPGVRLLDAALWPGHEPLLEVHDAAGLLGATQMNVVEFHTWNASLPRLDKPDRMVFDLDPGAGVAWPAIQEGAQLTRALLQALGLQCWLKTSGGKGLHLVVPLAARWDHATVKAFSKAVVEHLAATIPARFVAKSGPANRVGRIFVDYLRNGEGATTVAAYSARARPGLGVSMPVSWDELPQLTGAAQFTVANARDHLSLRKADPWQEMAAHRQSLSGPMKALQAAVPAGAAKRRRPA